MRVTFEVSIKEMHDTIRSTVKCFPFLLSEKIFETIHCYFLFQSSKVENLIKEINCF